MGNSRVEGSLRDRSDIFDVFVKYTAYLCDAYIGTSREGYVDYTVKIFGIVIRQRRKAARVYAITRHKINQIFNENTTFAMINGSIDQSISNQITAFAFDCYLILPC